MPNPIYSTSRRWAAFTLTSGLFAAALVGSFMAPAPAQALVDQPTTTTASPSTPATAAAATSTPTPVPTASDPGHTMGSAGKNAPGMLQGPAGLGFGATPRTLTAPAAIQPSGTNGLPLGMDVSGWQQNVDWSTARANGAQFAYIKASEGPSKMNDYFDQQYNGSAAAGLIRGAYHFARPTLSSGANQAQVFVQSGGGWSADGKTLPGVLDLEANGSDNTGTCFGMTASQLVSWTQDFTTTYKALTGRDAVIYTAYYFWHDCLGDSSAFALSNPLWIAAYGAPAGDVWLPGGWPQFTFWQYADTGTFPGDQNLFNGSLGQLQILAATASSEPATLLAKGASSSTIYLISGSTKYPIPDWSTYLRYQGIGALLSLDDGYLASLATGSTVGRFVRSPNGAISLLSGGSLYPVPSCSMMNDFGGGQCTGWVPLSNAQLAQFGQGPQLTNAVTIPGGRNLFISMGIAREYFDSVALAQAGLPTAQLALSEDIFAGFPQGMPIMRADVIVIDRTSGIPYLYTLGQLHAVPTSINDENVWTRSLVVYKMDAASLNQLTKSGPYTGWATNSSGTQFYLVGSKTKNQLPSPPTWNVSLIPMSDALLALTLTGGRISLPAAVSTDGSSDVYQLDAGSVRHVPDWTTFTNLFGPMLPPIVSLPSMVMKNFTTADGILPLGKLYVSPASPAVYLSDGATSLVALPDFSIAAQLGISGYSWVSAAALSPYKASTQVLTPILGCNGAKYIRLSGAFSTLSTSTSSTSLLPSTSLAASTCRALGIPVAGSGTISATVFVKDNLSSTVYWLQGTFKRPVGSWDRLVALNGGNANPVIAVYDAKTLAGIATGSAA